MLEPDSTLVLSMVAVPTQAALQMHSYWIGAHKWIIGSSSLAMLLSLFQIETFNNTFS